MQVLALVNMPIYDTNSILVLFAPDHNHLGLSFPSAYLCFICTGGGSELERRGKFREGFPTKGYISIFKTR